MACGLCPELLCNPVRAREPFGNRNRLCLDRRCVRSFYKTDLELTTSVKVIDRELRARRDLAQPVCFYDELFVVGVVGVETHSDPEDTAGFLDIIDELLCGRFLRIEALEDVL